MLTIIQERIVNVPITSITLSTDPTDVNGLRLHMFFCYNCGTPLGQYTGFVYSIMPGANVVSLPWIQRCNTCKRKFAINGIV